VTLERMLAFDLPRASQRETLLGPGIGLHFRHFCKKFLLNSPQR
jgi:hypothetical protein